MASTRSSTSRARALTKKGDAKSKKNIRNPSKKPAKGAAVRRKRKDSNRHSSSKLNASGKVRRINAPQNDGVPGVLPGGKIPPWQTLPYEILFSIFKFASFPLVDDLFRRNQSVPWLISTATVCKAFCEPALSALYESPPITFAHHLRSLDSLVRKNGPKAIEYGNKIHQLNLHIEHTRFAKLSEEVGRFLPLLPGLRGLGLYSYNDDPRSTKEKSVKVVCDPQYHWIDGLERANTHLQRLHVNGFSISSEDGGLATVLARREFSFLNKLSLSSMSPQWLSEVASKGILASLVHLESLTFARCGFSHHGDIATAMILDSDTASDDMSILECIPQNLVYLSFVQCTFLRSEELRTVLRLSGKNLKELDLRHNDSLDLRFISELGSDCPRLETFCYDLSLFSPLIVSTHHEPDFKEMLTLDDTPDWPSTLQRIELTQLRHWDTTVAEAFFKSLMSAAPYLKNLRRIQITASVGAGWRERASFRENIIGPIYKVFQRRWTEPKVHQRLSENRSIKAKEEHMAKTRAIVSRELRSSIKVDAVAHEADQTPPRRSNRQRSQANTSGMPVSAVISSRRADSVDSSASDIEHEGSLLIQGKCDYVHVRVDNLRPAEDQLNEADFIDSERSGDEAWDPARGDVDQD